MDRNETRIAVVLPDACRIRSWNVALDSISDLTAAVSDTLRAIMRSKFSQSRCNLSAK